MLRNPRPYDTTTLNYNWQIWETKAFSLYTTVTAQIDRESPDRGVRCIMNFLAGEEMLTWHRHEDSRLQIMESYFS